LQTTKRLVEEVETAERRAPLLWSTTAGAVQAATFVVRDSLFDQSFTHNVGVYRAPAGLLSKVFASNSGCGPHSNQFARKETLRQSSWGPKLH